MLASTIASCPNLEGLGGLTRPHDLTPYCDPVVSALSTRLKLKEHLWQLDATSNSTPDRTNNPSTSTSQSRLSAADSTSTLIRMHANWSSLQTLAISGVGIDMHANLQPGTISAITHNLPSLRHLFLSNLPADLCHAGTLHSLPSLHSLRLDNLPAIDDAALTSLTHSRTLASLRKLSLVNLSIATLRTIQLLLASAPHLTRFTLQQSAAPGLPLGASCRLHTSKPLLAHPGLTFIHWDTLSPSSDLDALAQSIRTHGFPHLRRIRVPLDPDGKIQTLCRPIPRTPISETDVAELDRRSAWRTPSRRIRDSRTAAQLRLRENRRSQGMAVVVQDFDASPEVSPTRSESAGSRDSGVGLPPPVKTKKAPKTTQHVVGGYLGDMGSAVEYCLEPDFEGAGEALGQVGDLGTRVNAAGRGCDGRWRVVDREDWAKAKRKGWRRSGGGEAEGHRWRGLEMRSQLGRLF